MSPGGNLIPLDMTSTTLRLLFLAVPGAFFVVTGLCLIVNKKARLAATWLGLMILVLVIVVYVPIVIAKPSSIGNGLNYLVDTLLLSGSALALAGAQRGELMTRAA